MCPIEHNSTPQPAQRVLSLLSQREVESLGQLPGEAILGVYVGSTNSVESFRPNRTFIDFLHHVIADHGSRLPEFITGAREQQNGWLYVIDLRTPEGPDGRVEPQDIIGAFQVRDGELVSGSYLANDSYRVLTENGPTRLSPAQREAFISALPRASNDRSGREQQT